MDVAVFFGGKTCEHSISVITAVQAMKAIEGRHKALPIYIDEEGQFWLLENKQPSLYLSEKNRKGGKRIYICPGSCGIFIKNGKKRLNVDVALLCNHGVNGEDGTLQGLLELCGIAYTGSSVCASSAGLDKSMMKKVFSACNLNLLPHLSFTYDDYKNSLFSMAEKIKEKLTFPLIVKPSSLGSSIGIGIAKDFEQLYECLDAAFEWDNSVVVENALEGFKELNCAVLGIDNDLVASNVESPMGFESFLTFKDKYVSKSSGSMREFPAKIDSTVKVRVQECAKEAFRSLGCSGVARVDFLYKDDELYVNEINTIPGALSNYLFLKCEEESHGKKTKGKLKAAESKPSEICEGIEFSDLVDRLIMIAIENKKRKERLNYRFKPTFGITGKGGGRK